MRWKQVKPNSSTYMKLHSFWFEADMMLRCRTNPEVYSGRQPGTVRVRSTAKHEMFVELDSRHGMVEEDEIRQWEDDVMAKVRDGVRFAPKRRCLQYAMVRGWYTPCVCIDNDELFGWEDSVMDLRNHCDKGVEYLGRRCASGTGMRVMDKRGALIDVPAHCFAPKQSPAEPAVNWQEAIARYACQDAEKRQQAHALSSKIRDAIKKSGGSFDNCF